MHVRALAFTIAPLHRGEPPSLNNTPSRSHTGWRKLTPRLYGPSLRLYRHTAPCTPTSLPSSCQSIHYLCVLKRSSVGTKSAHVQSRIVYRIKILWKVYAFYLLTGSLLYRRVARRLKPILKYFRANFRRVNGHMNA